MVAVDKIRAQFDVHALCRLNRGICLVGGRNRSGDLAEDSAGRERNEGPGAGLKGSGALDHLQQIRVTWLLPSRDKLCTHGEGCI